MQKDNAEFARQIDYQLMGTFGDDQHSESVQIGGQGDESLHGTTTSKKVFLLVCLLDLDSGVACLHFILFRTSNNSSTLVPK